MAAPIFYMAPEFTQYSGYYLKAYQSGTTIVLDIFLDEAETISVDKLIVNSQGFFENNGSVVTPRIGGRYDLFLFPTEKDADEDRTSVAIRVAQATAAEILLGEGGAIELATQQITGIVKFEGTDDSQGSVIKNITNSRDAVKLVFNTLKYTAQDIIDLSDDVWITPAGAFQMIEDAAVAVTEDWNVGEIIYHDDITGDANDQFLKMDGQPFDGSVYPRLAAKSHYKSKNISNLTTVNPNVDIASRTEGARPVIVRADDTFYQVVKQGDAVYIYESTDGINYTFLNVSLSYINDVSDDNFHAAYDGENKIILLTNSDYGFYDIAGNSFDTINSVSDLAVPAFVHFNTRLNKYVTFSQNGLNFYFGTITKEGVYVQQSTFASSNSNGANQDGTVTAGNDGSANIHYSPTGNYFVVFDKISDTVIYKIGERFLTDAFNEDRNIYNMTTGSSPLLNGSTAGISTDLSIRCGAAVNDDKNFAVIDYATDLETSILVYDNEVFSYKVIVNPFPINNKSCIIPLGGSSYILVGDNGDGIAYTNDNFDTIALSNSTSNGTAIGKIGTGSAIFVNESNKFIISLQVGSENQLRYVDITATKVSDYATIDLTHRSLGETSYYVFAGTPE